MIKFEKVSFEQFEKDFKKIFDGKLFDEDVKKIYDNIKLPQRATKGSAGYDFFAPFTIVMKKFKDNTTNEAALIPTGIRVILPEDKILSIYPRSGLGFKYGVRLLNTVGIIDSDYSYSDNEGHIMIKMKHDFGDDVLVIQEGMAFAQSVITKYYTTDDDNANNERNGGFGSTDSN